MNIPSPWVREHRRALSWSTAVVALLALTWMLEQHGGWVSLFDASVDQPWMLAIAVALLPANLGLEAWKWRHLSSNARVGDETDLAQRPWSEVWPEVLGGQTWALLGPFRLADGIGRLALCRNPKLRGKLGAGAFARGAAAQGWATWAWMAPAMFIWQWHVMGMGLLVFVGITGFALLRHTSLTTMALSAARYVVFAVQYLLCLSSFGAIIWQDWWTEGYPRIAAIWCAVGTLPWPAELGLREAVATWAFDENIPAVVAATFMLWLLNRCIPAFLGLAFVGDMWRSKGSDRK